MRKIISAHSKKDLIKAIGDVNYEIVGKELAISDNDFSSLWKSDFLNNFFSKRGILIDDYETTFITNNKDLSLLEETIKKSTSFRRKRDLLELIAYAIEKKSGIVFIF